LSGRPLRTVSGCSSRPCMAATPLLLLVGSPTIQPRTFRNNSSRRQSSRSSAPISLLVSSYELGSSGTVRLIGWSSSGHACRWKETFTISDVELIIPLSVLNYTLPPNSVKIDIDIHCPWKEELYAQEPSIDRSWPLYLRARRLQVRWLIWRSRTHFDRI
jgi:hypothetical protein